MSKGMDREKIREILSRKMQEQNISMRQLAPLAGLASHSNVSRALGGQISLSRDLLVRLALPLHCTEEELTELFHAAMYLPPTEEELEDALQPAA